MLHHAQEPKRESPRHRGSDGRFVLEEPLEALEIPGQERGHPRLARACRDEGVVDRAATDPCVPARRRSRSSVSPTASGVRGATRLRRTAMVSDPRLTSRTSSGAGSISMRPSATPTVRAEPGGIPAASRIFLGTTSLPARSMVVFIAVRLPLSGPAPTDQLPIPSRVRRNA